MTVSVVGSNNETVIFQTRKVKGSDLETDATLLDLDDIPMPSGVLDSNNQTYANFSALYADLPTNQNIRGPEGPQGPAIDSVSLAQSVDLSTVTMTFGYTQNNQGYTVGTTPSFTIPAGPTGPTGAGIQFVSHDTQNHTLTFQFTDARPDLTVDLPQGDTGPAGRSISSISKSGDVMTINYDDGSSPTQISGIRGPAGDAATITVSATNTLAAGASATVTETGTSNSQNRELIFGIPAGADGVDGDDGVSITDVNQVNSTTINFSKSDSTTTSNITLPVPTADDILPTYTSSDANKVLALNSTGDDFVWIAGSGTGTVTSVGITGSNGISVTGSPVTTSGSIGVSLSLGANLTYNTSTQQIDATDTDTTYSVADANNDGLMSSSDFSKLEGIAAQANKYVLPAATANDLGGIKVGTNLSITQDGTLSATDTDTTYSVATTSADGLLSSADKSKLDGVATNANNYALPIATANDLGGFKVGANLTINSTTGVLDATDTDTTYTVATTSADGLMSSADKTKLDGIATNANNYALPIATANDLGGFKVGANLTINSTTGVLDATDTNTTYTVATTSADGLMSSTDKSKLNGIDASANNYSLPTATSSVLGGIKVGANLTITNGVLDATDTDTTYSVATTSADGLMSSTDKSKLNGIDSSANNYSLPIASASTLGGFKVGTNLSIDANTGVSATGGGGSTVDPVVMALALG